MDIKIGLLGFGTVGAATAKYLLEQQSTMSQHSQATINLSAIFTRSPQKVRAAGMEHLLVDNIEKIIKDETINCVVELMGGIDFPKKIILDCIRAKKHIVTANKALLAYHGKEILECAREHGVSVAFEASCAGGIPIIKALTEGLTANKHSAIYGVMNGTCNFILTEMDRKQLSFEQALANATEIGLAEADPSLDIEGYDAGHKIAILSSLAFRMNVDMDSIPILGIHKVKNKDINLGKKLNYTIKLIAAAIRIEDSVSIWVHPAFIPEEHPMTHVDGSFNAISTIGDEVGHTFYYGRGAGGQPTNSAIISDIIALSKESYQRTFSEISNFDRHDSSSLVQVGIAHMDVPIYIRILVSDKPGVLAQITTILAKYNISIARTWQEDIHANLDEESAELIIITHSCQFCALLNAEEELLSCDFIKEKPSIYPIIESPQDHLH